MVSGLVEKGYLFAIPIPDKNIETLRSLLRRVSMFSEEPEGEFLPIRFSGEGQEDTGEEDIGEGDCVMRL